MELIPIILAGGGGTRLWPLSREHYPKQFLALQGEQSLLQQTLGRLEGLSLPGGAGALPPMVVCNEEHRFLVAEQARSAGYPPGALMLEPVGRNTAPALTCAALVAAQQGRDPLLLMMPADHVIADRAAFQHAVASAAVLADSGRVVTFGIVPDRPETGYGYIRRGNALEQTSAFELDGFVEKPDADRARSFLESGAYYWNSGIFLMRASAWLGAIGRHRPDILAACERACAHACMDKDFTRLDREAFEACPSDSIDYAVMEPLSTDAPESTAVVPLAVGWSDVGSWSSLWDIAEKDDAGNAVQGDVHLCQSTDSMVVAEHRFVAALGCEGLVIVETPDAVMVARKDRAQDVKRIVEWLRANSRSERLSHRRVYRPWGSYEGVDGGSRFQVKRIVVDPGASLSLQMHHHRAEHWIVVNGTALVTCGDKEFLLSENQSTYIPLGTTHRLANPGTIPLELVEVQSGAYLGEDDIVRFEDKYDRHTR